MVLLPLSGMIFGRGHPSLKDQFPRVSGVFEQRELHVGVMRNWVDNI